MYSLLNEYSLQIDRENFDLKKFYVETDTVKLRAVDKSTIQLWTFLSEGHKHQISPS